MTASRFEPRDENGDGHQDLGEELVEYEEPSCTFDPEDGWPINARVLAEDEEVEGTVCPLSRRVQRVWLYDPAADSWVEPT